jgi:exosortase/archaeosortase family protein
MDIENRRPILLKISISIILPLILYWGDFVILAKEALYNELTTYILLMPFLVGYLIYRLRHVILASISFPSKDPALIGSQTVYDLLGYALCLLAVFMKWYGSYTFNPLEYHIGSLPLFISGIILIIFNRRTFRVLLFPVFFTLFLVPPPLNMAQRAGAFLSVLSALFSYRLMNWLGYPVTLGSDFGTPIIYLQTVEGSVLPFAIDLACSGLYSLIGLVIFTTFFAYISKGSLRRKALFFVSGFPIIYLLNIIRITVIVLVGYYMGTGRALDTIHLLGGWTLTFIGTLIIILISEKVFKIAINPRVIDSCQHEPLGNLCNKCGRILKISETPLLRQDLFKLVGLLIVVIFVATVQVPTFTLTSAQAEVLVKDPSGDEVTQSILPEIEGYDLDFFYRDYNFERIAGQNASLLYVYDYVEEDQPATIWVQIEIGETRGNLHNWELCLISYPALIGDPVCYERVDQRDIHLIENPPLSARYFAFNEINKTTTQVVLYWFTQTIFETRAGYEYMWSKISVIKYVPRPEDFYIAEAKILPIAKAIAEYWQPIGRWSEVSLTLARYGPYLIGITSLVILGLVIYNQLIENSKRTSASMIIDKITNVEDLKIIQAFKDTGKDGLSETEILEKISLDSEEFILRDYLVDWLRNAEDMGIVEQSLANRDNRPYMTWILKT